ncbi:ParB/Srx family N-terminal domain-containing protein [Xenorhabdus sp. XENO-7]|uniref:ParB/Srx family N-terminal domain-containing protein n=1 Tax=Xenorhabdus aichiensis TaxID=3025874 RepID=A0ABT5M627_9GAMM|nr:ParB/Srx family N-terminal domain-containing protein [Xenorhabdus aichiensis]MDC9622408.1 ParB/Srx family N-terminal domain-containing protein [Xenorhabdus aichiensis]
MSRKDFILQKNISINDLLMDTENARIRAGSDQKNCISRILRKEKQMLILIEDIAKNGLTTMPILITPTYNGKWIVKDGNRRITALKLLNSPEICPEPHLKNKIISISNNYKHNITSFIDCLSSENKEAIINEIIARHSGTRDGAGQYDWSAYMKTIFLLNNEHPSDYKRAGQYMCWAEKEGLDVEDDFPISTTARFFNKENLNLLGFEIENDQLKPILSKEKIIKMASKINNDFSNKIVDVNDVFKPEHATNYLNSVRNYAGILDIETYEDNTIKTDADEKNSLQNFSHNLKDNTKQKDENTYNKNCNDELSRKSIQGKRGRIPRKSPAERNKIFGRTKIGINIPEDAVKVRMIVAELRLLDVKKITLAVTVLLRALLELSDREYRALHHIKDNNGLAKNIATSADHMLSNELINKSEHNIIIAYTRGEQGILHIETLQKFLHRESHHPDYHTINTFWDNIGCFVRACWKD